MPDIPLSLILLGGSAFCVFVVAVAVGIQIAYIWKGPGR